MTLLASYTRTTSRLLGREETYGKDPSLNYVLAFAALGIFVSLVALALGDASFAAAW
jgi:hypothetical protein